MKLISLILVLLISSNVFAENLKEFYVTQAGCRVYDNIHRDEKKVVNIWMALSSSSTEYDPSSNISASMEAQNTIETRRECEELYQIFRTGRKAVFNVSKELAPDNLEISDFAQILTSNFSSRIFDENGTAEQLVKYREVNLEENVVIYKE